MDNEVGFDDLRAALDRAWDANGLPRTKRSVDVIVHSTGALVIRDWMTHHFKANTNPINRLLMLAPANFGSPLAHKGKAFLGRVVKGWRSEKRFQTGKRILTGLELGSDFSYELAKRDCFVGSGAPWYGKGACLATVLVGNTGYSGVSSLANEEGGDGTVRVSTAALNPVLIKADFSIGNPKLKIIKSKGEVGLGVIEGDNHSTIAFKSKGPKGQGVEELVLKALKVTDNSFDDFLSTLRERTKQTMLAALELKDSDDREYRHGFQNTVFFVKDHFGNPVEEYFLDFTVKDHDKKGFLGRFFQEKAIRKVHNFSGNEAYRSIHIDCTRLAEKLDKSDESMILDLHGEPQLKENKYVGFRPLGAEGGGLKITQAQAKLAFVENRTALVEITLRREQVKKVFELNPMG